MNTDKNTVLITFIALAVVALYTQTILHFNDNNLLPPGLDPILYFQYAAQFAEGHPFQYNSGDPPTTGATSFLFTLLLSIGYLIGFKGMSLFAYSYILAAVSFWLSAILVYKIGHRIHSERIGLVSSIIFVLSGSISFNYLHAQDLFLFSTLFLYLIWVFVEKQRLCWHSALVGSLFVLTRLDGAVVYLFLLLLHLAKAKKLGYRDIAAFIPLLVGCGLAVLNHRLTGSIGPTSILGQSLFVYHPRLDVVYLSLGHLVDLIKGLFSGYYSSSVTVGTKGTHVSLFFPPFMMFFFIWGILGRLRHKPSEKSLDISVPILGIILFAVVTSSLTIQTGVAFFRYIVWIFPFFILYGIMGLGEAAEVFGQRGKGFFRALSIFFIVFSLIALPGFALTYGRWSQLIHQRQMTLATWINRNIPDGSRIISKGRLHTYLTGGKFYEINLCGISSPEFLNAAPPELYNHVYETLQEYEPNQLPQYYIASAEDEQSVQSLPYGGMLEAKALFRSGRWGFPGLTLYETDFAGLYDGEQVVDDIIAARTAHLDLVDELDVSNVKSEEIHEYKRKCRISSTKNIAGAPLESSLGGQTFVDGGYPIQGSESFKVSTVPGKALTVALRTSSKMRGMVVVGGEYVFQALDFPSRKIALNFIVNDEILEPIILDLPAAGEWGEYLVDIPGDLIRGEKTSIEVWGDYFSFHYWFYQ